MKTKNLKFWMESFLTCKDSILSYFCLHFGSSDVRARIVDTILALLLLAGLMGNMAKTFYSLFNALVMAWFKS